MRRALVTGASHGIGREVARMLLADGWEVHGISRTRADVPDMWSHVIDISETYQARRISRLLDFPLDALVHCAAIQGPLGPIWECDPAEWLATINTNLIGTYRVLHESLPALRRSGDGRVLLFSGGGAFNPRPNYSAYAVAKAGVVSLMETTATELRDTSVTINCVSPGFVATGLDPNAAVLPYDPDGSLAMARVVECVQHLLSPATRGLNGKTVSAEYDDWRSFDQHTVAGVNASVMGTRTRRMIAMVGAGVGHD